MTLVKDPRTGAWTADITDRHIGRVHLSLRTRKKAEAQERHAALRQLIREGYADLVDAMRRTPKRLNIEAVTRVHQARQSFETLRASATWPTLREATDAYLQWIETHPHRAANTHRAAESRLDDAMLYFGGGARDDDEEARPRCDVRLDAITGDMAQAYQAHLVGRGVKPSTVYAHLSRLAALYQWVVKEERRRAHEQHRVPKVLHSPVDRERMPKNNVGRVRFLSEEEATRLLAASPASLRAPIALGILAGLRINEMLHLRVPPFDIDLDLGLLYIQSREEPVAWHPKGRKNREVPISSALLPILKEHVARYSEAPWLLPSPMYEGVPVSRIVFSRYFRRIVKDAELGPDVTFHVLRHTFASWLVMAGVDLFTVARLLGHSSTSMVETTYGHLAPEHKRAAVERLATKLTITLDGEEPPHA